MDNLAGQHIKGYELQERIAAGGFGAVYRAYQSTVGREVAIKVILPGLANKPDFIRRFEAEAQLIARLEHMNIVPLHDYWRDPDGAYLVMRYLRGGSLHDRIHKHGPLNIEDTFHLFSQVAQGLHVAHRSQVIHRDIKPSNILLDEDGNGYLADFGIAKDHATTQSTTDPGSFIGSPEYLAPEQARSEPVTPHSDIYSLGVVLYEMLAGEHPFPGLEKIGTIFKHLNDPLPAITTLDNRISNDVNDVIQKATAKDPRHRFEDVIVMKQALRQAAQLDIAPTPTSVVELLTPREQEVMQLISDGKSNREIADILVLAEGTIKQYIKSIYRKLKVRSRVQAIARTRDLNFVIQKPEATVRISTGHFPEPDNPYKGLRAFQAADAQDFFGREKLTQKLLGRLKENGQHQRFLAIVGPSGSGKSSVVKAGLIPALWRGDLQGSEHWYIVDMLPGKRPLDELEVSLLRIAGDHGLNLRDQLERDTHGLLRAANLILPDDDSELLIVIDQFEEVFTLVEDEDYRQHFVNLLYQAINQERSRVRVVVTLRADYYDRPLHYPDFGELMRSRVETVLPLGAEELERAISEPAHSVGVQFEDGLVSRLVSDAHYQPGALPLLQYALTELFERRDARILTSEAYREIGRTGGALAKRADEIYLEGNEERKELIRQLFLRLITLGEGAEDTRRRVAQSELIALAADRELMDEIIDLYAESRLLSLDNDPFTRKPIVEVAHEAILREWDRLRQWLNESREDIRQEQLIAQAAESWKANNHDMSYLLTGTRLEQAETWNQLTKLVLTPLEKDFIQTSVQESKAQEIAEAERQVYKVAQERRSRTLLRVLVIVFAVATILSGGFGVFALNARDAESEARLAAEAAEQEALTQASIGIAALAENESGKANAERGVLLALEALEYYPYTPQAQSALLQAIDTFIPVQILDAGSMSDWVEAASWSPDGSYVAGAGGPSPMGIVIWDVESGSEMFAFGTRAEFDPCGEPDQPISIPVLSWSPSGESLATVVNHFDPAVEYSCGVILWDPNTGLRQLTLGAAGQAEPILSMDWAPDGNTLLTGGGNIVHMTEGGENRVTLWDAHTGEERQLFTGHTDVVWDVKFSPDGSVIATASADGSIRLWEVESGSQLRVLEGHFGAVQSIAWSPDGNSLVSGGSDGLPRIWDTQSGEVVLVLPGHTGTVIIVDWSADGTRIVSQSLDGTVRLWDAATGGLALEIPNAGNPIFAYKGFSDFSPDGNQLLTTDTHLIGQVYLWDITASVPLLFGHTDGGDYAAWSPDGHSIVTSSYDGTMRIWDAVTGQPVVTRDDLGTHWGRWGDWSPDSSRLVIPFGPLTIFDAETGETLAALPQDRFGYFGTDWSPDGSLIVTSTSGADPEQQTFIIDADTYEVVTTLQTDDSCVEGWPHFSPDSTKIATGCQFVESGTNTPTRIWDAQTGEELMSLESEHGWSYRTLWSSDGTRMLVTYEHGVARIWHIATQEVELTYSGHLGQIWSAAWSPDGSLIASSDQTTKQVNIWDAQTGEEIISFAVPSNINTISWSPDGKYVILFGDSITEPVIKRVWASTDELIAHAYECCVTRELTSEERQQFGLPNR